MATLDDHLQEKLFTLTRRGQLGALRRVIDELDSIERKACLTAQDAQGNTLLLTAILQEFPNIVELLLTYEETRALHRNALGENALSLAARFNRPFLARCVLRRILGVDELQKGNLVGLNRLAEIIKPTKGHHGVRWAFAKAALIDFYAELSTEEVSLCVLNSFKRRPAACLYECVSLASAVQLRSNNVRILDPTRGEELSTTSGRIQLAVSGCLDALYMIKDSLGRFEVDELLLVRALARLDHDPTPEARPVA